MGVDHGGTHILMAMQILKYACTAGEYEGLAGKDGDDQDSVAIRRTADDKG